jgi:hypothetical protein
MDDPKNLTPNAIDKAFFRQIEGFFTCEDCYFARVGKLRGDYNRKTGKREWREALLCTLDRPTANGRAETSDTLTCALFTDKNLAQPLRHLAGKERA